MKESKTFGKIFENMPIEVVYHLKKLIKSTGLPEDTRSFNRFMESWLAKRGEFDKIVEQGNYTKEKIFKANNNNSCIAMTISGSLVTLEPLVNGKRTATYTSIGMRTDVPMVKVKEGSELDSDIEIHKSIVFKVGPVKSTSLILDIAVIGENIDSENQIKQLSSANEFLLKRFMDINIDFLSDKYKDTDLINRNDLFDCWIILTWFQLGGIEDYIFLARVKLVWLELFLKFYEHLSKKGYAPEKRDQLFIDITNVKFAKYIMIYKLLQQEIKDFDNRLLEALEEIPSLDSYAEFRNDFYKEFD